MKRFQCSNCHSVVHFDNVVCLQCNSTLGFDPATLSMIAFADEPKEYVRCANAETAGCNWLVSASDEIYCYSCRMSQRVPDLSNPEHAAQWSRLEAAKRHFLFGLMRLGLPIVTRADNPDEGLAFELLADPPAADGAPVMTGHHNGLITINVSEADDPEREARRVQFGENLRTLLAHFRHESGHFYWNLLVRDREGPEAARRIFGDEREDYQAALDRYYAEGPRAGWQDEFISAYASAHPWEDFAETWAHYLHIVDGLETAYAYDLRPLDSSKAYKAGAAWPLETILSAWVQLTISINAVNRSIGQPDLYSFVFSPTVTEKLRFIHQLVTKTG